MPHLYQDDVYCFLTTATRWHENYLAQAHQKEILLQQILKARDKFGFYLCGFSIMDSHYHCLFYLKKGYNLSRIAQLINGGSSYIINKQAKTQRSIWDNYWSVLIRDDKIFYNVLGYVIANPLKHGLVKNFEELGKYPFGNYEKVVQKYGKETVKDMINNVILLNWEEGSIDKLAKAR